jgi:hypothetical protein
MDAEIKAGIIEQGGKLLSDLIRMSMNMPRNSEPYTDEITEEETHEHKQRQPVKYHAVAQNDEPAEIPVVKPAVKSNARHDLDYRWECCAKHLGAASVLLREAYDRARDGDMGDGTAEKIMAAMNEHAGMEDDLGGMLDFPEVKPLVDKIQSGARAFRAAAWKAKLPVGGGTKEDVADARVWNDIMLSNVLEAAKANPGSTCVASGM